MFNILFISLLSTIIFGIIDSSIFLMGENIFQKRLMNIFKINLDEAELITGGISGAISIFFASVISNIIEKNYKTIEHPLIEAFGIILGTLFIVFIYKLFFKYNENK